MSNRLYLKIIVFVLWLAGLTGAAAAATQDRTDEAFRLTVERNSDQSLTLNWQIASGYYLYRDQFAVSTSDGGKVSATIPEGQIKDDPNFGAVEIYHDHAEARIEAGDLPASGTIKVAYQGCAEKGVCLPPVEKMIDLQALAVVGGPGAVTAGAVAPSVRMTSIPSQKPPAEFPKDERNVLSSLFSGGYAPLLASFLGFGLMLALTPCVFPMIPILSGVLAGAQRPLSAGRGFMLSFAYVLAMAAAYASLGVAAAWGGQNLQVMLQAPAAIGLMSLVFVVLALSMFGLYELQLPAAWTQSVAGATTSRSGSIGGAALIGFGSALIVGPCVTPPLAAALIYVAQTGDVPRGAAALFAFGLGMGLPMIAFGTFGARLLPKSGNWLAKVKQVFGFVFVGLAIWILSRVVAAWVATTLWGVLAVAFGLWLGARDLLLYRIRWTARLAGELVGAAAVLCGLAVFALGAAGGLGPNVVRVPDAFAATRETGFVHTVSTPDAFDGALAAARESGLPILVDFTAQWCSACKAIERNVLTDPATRARLKNVAIIRADMTHSTSESQALMQRFGVAGPPTLLFLAPGGGREIEGARSVGEITVYDFNLLLDRAGA